MLLTRSLIALGVLTIAACGETATNPTNNPSGASNAAFTVSAANVNGVGMVLVNGNGQTLYILSSEQGGKVTCTNANGCLGPWPAVELPSGVTQPVAGSGINQSLLTTITDADGKLRVAYGGYPLYTFVGDSGPMQANGQGKVSFGGTWTAIDVSGNPASVTATATTAASSSGGGYGAY